MRWPKTAAAALLVAAVLIAWRLWPVQIMVTAYRFTHRVAPNHPVHWAEGPAATPAGPRPPNIVLIVADDLGINDIAAEVAKLAMQLEGPNSPIEAMLGETQAAATPARPASGGATGGSPSVAPEGGGTLAERIRALQSHASRARQQQPS